MNAELLKELDLESVDCAVGLTQMTLDSMLAFTSDLDLVCISGIISNLFEAKLARVSGYYRNRPNRYPDLLHFDKPGLEVKVCYGDGKPKGHLPKAGRYIVLHWTSDKGRAVIDWVRAGELTLEDFNCSSTPGDSGKTATVNSAGFKKLSLIFERAK